MLLPLCSITLWMASPAILRKKMLTGTLAPSYSSILFAVVWPNLQMGTHFVIPLKFLP